MSFIEAVKNILNKAVADCFPVSGPAFECQVTPCQDKKFGDYQSNLAFLLAKRERTSPRSIAGAVADSVRAQVGEPGAGSMSAQALIDTIEVAGAGFINIRIRASALIAELEQTLTDPRCGVAPVAFPQRIVVDYSSPNLAKDLHVGTMRSTVIGDSIARVLEFLGHDVLRQNHYGDWGANFGVLVAMIKQEYGSGLEQLKAAPLEAVEELYTRGSRLKTGSEEFAARGRGGSEQPAIRQPGIRCDMGGVDGQDPAQLPRSVPDLQRQPG